ncbi:MAG: hypothetical protein JW803_02915 [Endomicrobiales bacterium]|nr:hypothetical protein [Endomicrobiales bacterium]
MELSPEKREQIYMEEKARRETQGNSALPYIVIGITVGLASLLVANHVFGKKKVSIEDLRKAYDGLSPEDAE